MKIALSKTETNFSIYQDWLNRYNFVFEILDYEGKEDEISKMDNCSGLILTGGVDIYPEIYCDWDKRDTGEIYIQERDDFELRLIEIAVKRNLPIFAICRGCQLMNVYFKGDIILDLMEFKNVNHDRITPIVGRIHDINIFKNTLLHEILNMEIAEVNSYHHQAIDTLGEGLMINAKSIDGIIEGIEYADKKGKPFFLGIQWHPERFTDLTLPASENILKYFINECKKIS